MSDPKNSFPHSVSFLTMFNLQNLQSKYIPNTFQIHHQHGTPSVEKSGKKSGSFVMASWSTLGTTAWKSVPHQAADEDPKESIFVGPSSLMKESTLISPQTKAMTFIGD